MRYARVVAAVAAAALACTAQAQSGQGGRQGDSPDNGQAAAEAGCVEALLTLPDGTLTEGTHTSFFGVLDGTILTAPNSNAILPGVTRGLVLRLAQRAGVPVREQTLKRDDLGRVSELFLTGTTSEVLPVVQVDGRPVGNGRPGPVSRRLQEAFAEAVREFVSR